MDRVTLEKPVSANTTPPSSIDALAELLRLDPAMRDRVRAEIDGFRQFFADTMSRAAQGGGPSPVYRFVEAARAGAPDALDQMAAYAQGAIDPRSGKTYLEAVGLNEWMTRNRIAEFLPAHARETWRAFGDISLTGIATGNDPLGRVISETMHAVTNGSYVAATDNDEDASRYRDYFCPAPFEFATVDHSGHVFMCCPAWLGKAAGNLAERSWEDVWNSQAAQDIRASILDASFKYCNEANCPHLRGQHGRLQRRGEVMDPRHREIIEKNLVVMNDGPRDVTIQYDPTCNLTCPSCRCGVYKATKEEAALTQACHERVWTELVGTAKRLTIAGNGDPFASKLYRDALRAFDPAQYPNLKIALITNGLLLTPEMWESIANCHSAIESIHVSFNAATPETFRINQRGGELDKLLENLGPLSWARHAGEFPLLSLGFYVLDNNFREMKDIIAIGKKYKVDRVLFGHIMPPPYMVGNDDSGYRAMAVHLPEHPLHGEFLEYLCDPIFLDPMIAMTNLTPYLPDYQPHAAPAGELREHMSAAELCAWLDASAEQAAEIRRALAKFGREFSTLMFVRPAPGQPGPGHVLAEVIADPLAGPTRDELDTLEAFAATHNDPTTGLPYSQVARDLERGLRRAVLTKLDARQRAQFAALPLRSLLDVQEARAFFLTRVRATAERSLAQ